MMGGLNKAFKIKQLTTYLIVKLDLVKPKERKLPKNTDQDGFWSGLLSGPGNSSEWSLVSLPKRTLVIVTNVRPVTQHQLF